MKIDVVESALINATKLLDNFSHNIAIFGSARINQEHGLANKKSRRIKIFLLGLSFWSPIITWFKTLEQQGYISQQDLNSFCLVDETAQILTSIKEA